MVGTTIGHYRIEAETGSGGMGVVYRAVDIHLKRPVAIKLLHAGSIGDPDRRRRFVVASSIDAGGRGGLPQADRSSAGRA